jgi:type IV pilus assembly protein PilW
MNTRPMTFGALPRRTARGFTIVEILVAMTIALFLLGGLLTILQGTRRTFTTQNQLAQLQDNERLAMSLMTDVIQSAGYFPNPAANQATAALPASTGLTPAGQFANSGSPTIIGVPNASAQGDTITVRYAAGYSGTVSDNVFDCTGNQNTGTSPYDSWENKFSVVVQPDGTPWLACTVLSIGKKTATGPVLLVSGVQKLALSYGINTAGTGTGSCVDTYKTAAQMAAGDWVNVCSVVVTLTFTNQAAPGGPAPVTFTRVIALMNTAGVNT